VRSGRDSNPRPSA